MVSYEICKFPGYRSQGGERLDFCDMALWALMATLGDFEACRAAMTPALRHVKFHRRSPKPPWSGRPVRHNFCRIEFALYVSEALNKDSLL